MRLHLSRHSAHTLIGFASKKMYTHSKPLPFNILFRSGSCRHVCLCELTAHFDLGGVGGSKRKIELKNESTWGNVCGFRKACTHSEIGISPEHEGTHSNELVIDGKKMMPWHAIKYVQIHYISTAIEIYGSLG